MILRALKPFPLLVLLLAFAAAGGVTLLGNHADAARRAQLKTANLTLALTDLQAAPFNAENASRPVSAEIRADEAELSAGLPTGSARQNAPASKAAASLDLRRIYATVAKIYAIASGPGGLAHNEQVPALQKDLTTQSAKLLSGLNRSGRSDAAQAQRARLLAAGGTIGAILMLVGVFLIFYIRAARAHVAAERLVRENALLLETSQREARTDALTGIGNRRALTADLGAGLAAPHELNELLLATFDLNGFKQYNDTFGHGAGDALLSRLGGRLAAAVGSSGAAYRMGGDEFCVLARCSPDLAEAVLANAASALSHSGEDWSIDCSYGAVWAPSEAATPNEALLIADRRMYADKTSRSAAGR